MAQVAAHELGISLDKIHISETNTSVVANTSATAASASSDLNAMAIKNACDQINERLRPFREKMPDASWNGKSWWIAVIKAVLHLKANRSKSCVLLNRDHPCGLL